MVKTAQPDATGLNSLENSTKGTIIPTPSRTTKSLTEKQYLTIKLIVVIIILIEIESRVAISQSTTAAVACQSQQNAAIKGKHKLRFEVFPIHLGERRLATADR
jgi:hypothetical protein